MSEEMQIDGKTYISSKRAAALSTYAQDYIGQLARRSFIDARRIGGLWYVSMESLEAYKKKAEEYKPMPPNRFEMASEPETLIFFDGKGYLSAAKAAEETGYTQDYVGQLARSGSVLSRQVGNRWYIQRESILAHKEEKDALLAAVQSQAVGLAKKADQRLETKSIGQFSKNTAYLGSEPLLTYHTEAQQDLLPMTAKPESGAHHEDLEAPIVDNSQMIAIRRTQVPPARFSSKKRPPLPAQRSNNALKGSYTPLLLASAATIIIVLSIGYASALKASSVYASASTPESGMRSMAASAGQLFTWLGNEIEPFITHELIYQRSGSN